MPDTCSIRLPDAESTHLSGKSLASTLYGTDITIGLTGNLGAGKTTFLQGFLEGMGITETVASPTYALEQRYESIKGEIVHIDVYRLEGGRADVFLRESDDHDGIRCIEWIDQSSTKADILIHLEDDGDGRKLTVTFNDATLPTEEVVDTWRDEVALPDGIRRHCDAVADFAETLTKDLLNKGVIVRPQALRMAAKAHDLLRFLDFVPGASFDEKEPENAPEWQKWKDRYPQGGHEAACADFLRERGFAEIASIVEVHGLRLPSPERITIEQKLLFYADKRVKLDEVVTLEERFADFQKRYGSGEKSEESDIWFAEAKAVEQELLRG